MFRCKLQIVIIAFIATMSFPSLAQESRVNTLECSDDEVKAYMELADKSRFNELGFGHFESAYIVTVEEERAYMVAAGEVGACMGVLYGDISNMAKSVKDSLSGLSFGIGDLKEKATTALSELSNSICNRINAGFSRVEERIIEQGKAAVDDAYNEAYRRYGEPAMERYMNEKVMPPEFREAGLKYRNGRLDSDRLRRNVQSRWRSELEELEDGVTDEVGDF